MWDHFVNLIIGITLILLGFGGFLLFDSIAHTAPFQLPEVIGGAFLLALGLILLFSQAKRTVRWISRSVRAEDHRDFWP